MKICFSALCSKTIQSAYQGKHVCYMLCTDSLILFFLTFPTVSFQAVEKLVEFEKVKCSPSPSPCYRLLVLQINKLVPMSSLYGQTTDTAIRTNQKTHWAALDPVAEMPLHICAPCPSFPPAPPSSSYAFPNLPVLSPPTCLGCMPTLHCEGRREEDVPARPLGFNWNVFKLK